MHTEQSHPGHIRPHAPSGFTGALSRECKGSSAVNSIIYIVGLIVVVLAVLSFVGIR
jgi:hypothetical protein